MDHPEKTLAYALLRITAGVNFIGHGLFRILAGVPQFATATTEHMTKSPLPHAFVYGFAVAIPWIEVVLGIAIVLGLATLPALALSILYIISLTVGVTSNQDWSAAGQQLLYALVFFVLLFCLEYNSYSIDAAIDRNGRRVRRSR